MQWGVTRRLGMWHWHEGTWFPRSQWPPRGQGPAWTKPAPDHRWVMGALQLLGPRKGPCAQAPAVLRSETAAPAASSWMFKSNSEPRQRACLSQRITCAGLPPEHTPRAGTRLTPPRADLHQVSAGRPWHRQVNSAGDAPRPRARVLARCQAPGPALGRPLLRQLPQVLTAHRPCHGRLPPPPRFLES